MLLGKLHDQTNSLRKENDFSIMNSIIKKQLFVNPKKPYRMSALTYSL